VQLVEMIAELRAQGMPFHISVAVSPFKYTEADCAYQYLKLEKKIEPLSASTTTIVQSVSTIGLKYLELTPGHSRRTIAPGGTIPVSQSSEPVQIQDFFNLFDKSTRIAIQQNTNTFGDAFAGRGLGLNQTIATLRPLVKNAIPVLHNLASPQTGLGQLFVAFDKTATQVAPVAEQQAAFYVDLDTFFTAWAKAAPSLERTIEGGPAALHQAIYSLPYEAPFVEKSTEFMRLLRPSASLLRTTAGPLGHAFEVGARFHQFAQMIEDRGSAVPRLE